MADDGPRSFVDLGLGSEVAGALASLAIHAATPIQEECIPAILARKNCIGVAETGSGKTLAFGLPIIQKLHADPYGVYALILTPTRELAIQIEEQLSAVGKSVMSFRSSVVVGGMDVSRQGSDLAQQPHVVIATPGRLADVLNGDTAAAFRSLAVLVLDEADRVLDPSSGFAEQLETILGFLPPAAKRQTLMFTATISEAVEGVRESTDCVFVDVSESIKTAAALKQQEFIFAPEDMKEVFLMYFLEKCEDLTTIVFASSRKVAEVLYLLLKEFDITTTRLHALMSQQDRMDSLARFRSRRVRVLVATDVAARGLDIPAVDLVICFDVPRAAKEYVHRVGRAARAGREGRALTIISQYEVQLVLEVEEFIGRKLTEHAASESEVLDEYLSRVTKKKQKVLYDLEASGFGAKMETRFKREKAARPRRSAVM